MVRRTDAPMVRLEWNGETFSDLFGIADFIAMAGRALPELRKDHQAPAEVPGTRIRLE